MACLSLSRGHANRVLPKDSCRQSLAEDAARRSPANVDVMAARASAAAPKIPFLFNKQDVGFSRRAVVRIGYSDNARLFLCGNDHDRKVA